MQTAPAGAGIRPNSVTYVTAMRVASLHSHAPTGLALALAVLHDATSTDATAAAPADVVIYNAALSVCARVLKAATADAVAVCNGKALQLQQVSSNGDASCVHSSSSNSSSSSSSSCCSSSHAEALQGATLVLRCMAEHGVVANNSTVDVLVIINSALTSCTALHSCTSNSSNGCTSSNTNGCSSTVYAERGAYETAPVSMTPAAVTDTATTAGAAVTCNGATTAGGLAAVFSEWSAAGLLSEDTLRAVRASVAAAAAAAAAVEADAHASKQKLCKAAAVRAKKSAGFELSHTRCVSM
jgi:trimeric autotransporter adhesin